VNEDPKDRGERAERDESDESDEMGPETSAWTGLGEVWRGAEVGPAAAIDTAEIARRGKKFARTVAWRNLRELAACVLLLGVSVVQLVDVKRWLDALFPGSMIAAVVYVGAHIVRRGRNLDPPAPAATTTEHLAYERAQLDRQRRLLLSVRSWYLAPLAVPVVVAYAVTLLEDYLAGRDLLRALPALALGLAIAGGIFVLVDRLNARAAKKLGEKLDALGPPP